MQKAQQHICATVYAKGEIKKLFSQSVKGGVPVDRAEATWAASLSYRALSNHALSYRDLPVDRVEATWTASRRHWTDVFSGKLPVGCMLWYFMVWYGRCICTQRERKKSVNHCDEQLQDVKAALSISMKGHLYRM